MTNTMYRTIEVGKYAVVGILNTEEQQIVTRKFEVLKGDTFKIDGSAYEDSETGASFYPAYIVASIVKSYKCTMTESDFVKYGKLVDTRFVNGRTRTVTRNVKGYTATCLCWDADKQEMINSQFALNEDKGSEKNLQTLKRLHEIAGKFIIATVLAVTETSGIYAMTEKEFFERSEHEEITAE